ncbi:MAG: hypothetical protein Q4F23_04845 [Coriobacteriia bacterium]|nr:hypothetical protein [Coriobacteriia bacterium]
MLGEESAAPFTPEGATVSPSVTAPPSMAADSGSGAESLGANGGPGRDFVPVLASGQNTATAGKKAGNKVPFMILGVVFALVFVLSGIYFWIQINSHTKMPDVVGMDPVEAKAMVQNSSDKWTIRLVDSNAKSVSISKKKLKKNYEVVATDPEANESLVIDDPNQVVNITVRKRAEVLVDETMKSWKKKDSLIKNWKTSVNDSGIAVMATLAYKAGESMIWRMTGEEQSRISKLAEKTGRPVICFVGTKIGLLGTYIGLPSSVTEDDAKKAYAAMCYVQDSAFEANKSNKKSYLDAVCSDEKRDGGITYCDWKDDGDGVTLYIKLRPGWSYTNGKGGPISESGLDERMKLWYAEPISYFLQKPCTVKVYYGERLKSSVTADIGRAYGLDPQ